MRLMHRCVFSIACAFALFVQANADGVARAADFDAKGVVFFTNVQQGTQQGGIVPDLAFGDSDLIGPHMQTGSIRNLTGLIPVDATTFMFAGEVGPHSFLPGHPAVHVIKGEDGDIFCSWTAVFTLKIFNAKGEKRHEPNSHRGPIPIRLRIAIPSPPRQLVHRRHSRSVLLERERHQRRERAGGPREEAVRGVVESVSGCRSVGNVEVPS